VTSTLPHHPAGTGAAPLGPHDRDGDLPDGDRSRGDASGGDVPAESLRRETLGGEPSALDEAAARLAAWHAVRGAAAAGTGEGWDAAVGLPTQGRDAAPPSGPDEDDELAARLRARRSARHVAAAYAAAHGHVQLDDGDQVDDSDRAGPGGSRRRWSLGLRAAVVASVAVLLVAVVVAVVATLRPDDVITLAGADDPTASGVAAEGPAGAASASSPPSSAGPAAAGPAASGAPAPGADGVAGDGAAPGTVVVHVVGEVREPGLVTVPVGARVADAVAAAGGTTKRADTAALNLARAVVDGEQIRVPRPGEGPAAGSADDGTGTGADTGAGTGAAGGGLVPLNSAGAAELEQLPGIGPALAGRIIQWRDEHGPFTSVDELDEVSGIGPSVLGQVRDLVRL